MSGETVLAIISAAHTTFAAVVMVASVGCWVQQREAGQRSVLWHHYRTWRRRYYVLCYLACVPPAIVCWQMHTITDAATALGGVGLVIVTNTVNVFCDRRDDWRDRMKRWWRKLHRLLPAGATAEGASS